MSRVLDGVDDSVGINSTTPFDDFMRLAPGTIFIWFNVASDGQASTSSIVSNGRNTSNELVAVKTVLESGGNIALRVITNHDTDGQWDTAVDIPLNAWHAMGIDHDLSDVANNPSIWVDGVSDSLTEVVTPIGPAVNLAQYYMIGCRKLQGSNRRTVDGKLAHATAWTAALSATHQEALGRGANPFIMRNDILLVYTPLDGDESPEPNYADTAFQVTVDAAIKGSDNPPVELLENFM